MTENNASSEAAAGAVAAVAFLRSEHYAVRGFADEWARSMSDICQVCDTSYPCDVIDALDKYAAEPASVHDECKATAATLATAEEKRDEALALAESVERIAVQAVRGQLGVYRDATPEMIHEASSWRIDMESKLAEANRKLRSAIEDNASLARRVDEARAERDVATTIVDDARAAERRGGETDAPAYERLATLRFILLHS